MRLARGLAAGLAAALAGLVGNVGAPATVPPAGVATTTSLVGLPGTTSSPPGRFGARVLGPAPAATPVQVQLYFRPRSPGQLQALAEAVSSPGSPDYHKFSTVPEFAARFGASGTEVRAVDRYLRSRGLSVGALARDDLAQTVTGTARTFDVAFGTPVERVRTANGTPLVGSATAPRLPASVAHDVAFVDGLAPWVEESSDLVRFPAATHKAEAVTASTCSGMAGSGLTPAQLAAAYGFNGFYNGGDEGQGQTIGFIEYALADIPAIDTFQACTGSSVHVYYDPTPAPPKQVDAEVAADVEVIAALAPKATVVVYESNQAGTGLAPWQMAVTGSAPGGLPAVISTSWGSCEAQTGMGDSYYQEEQALFEEAATQGQTVLVAAGDDGSEGCYDQSGGRTLAVDDPASAPEVTAVGGTASDTLTGPEYVWNSRDASSQGCLGTGCSGHGAGGGGASSVWPRPSYQPVSLGASPACVLGIQGCREEPDVSALAGDPYAQYCSGTVCGAGSQWVGFGGTSLAAPSWGAAVLLSESLCASKVGFLNPLLYSEPTALMGLVRSGNNDLLGSHSGMYQASPTGSYSMAAGLGYLGGANLSTGALCGPGNLVGTAPSTTTTTSVPTVPTSSTTSTTAPSSTSSTTTSSTAPTSGATSSSSTTTTTSPNPAGRPEAQVCGHPVNLVVHGPPEAMAAAVNSGCAGYWVASQTGDVVAFGAAVNYGNALGKLSGSKVVAIVATPDSKGYWLLCASGRVFAFGDAGAFGQPYRLHLASAAVGMATTPDGQGYWVAAGDGGVFAYGDAGFYGAMSGRHLDRPITGLASTPDGKGYWLVGADGGVFGFGDADYEGSTSGTRLNGPVVGITAGVSPNGYRLVAASGGIFSFRAPYYGSLGADPPPAPVTMMAPTVDGRGYYLLDAAGDVHVYGDAAYLGSTQAPPATAPKKTAAPRTAGALIPTR